MDRNCLNLKLTITPELCNQIDCALAQAREEGKRSMDNIVPEKHSASNFSASSLTIGTWQRFSQREGDLVGKCYYKNKKIVWEILTGNRKSKIEILFTNIVAIKLTIHDNGDEELKIELKEAPDFAMEASPQPRKHTIWQSGVPDFTEKQALFCRIHVVKCRPGTLEKHYNLLLQTDSEFIEKSRRPFPTDEYPVFSAIVNMSTQYISRGVLPVDPLVRCCDGSNNGCLQQQPDDSHESNAPQISDFHPNGENFVTSALYRNHVGIIQEHNVLLPQRQGVVSLPPTVAPSPDLFDTNIHPKFVQSWVQTYPYNNGMTNIESADDVPNKVAPPNMVPSSSNIVTPSFEDFDTSTHHLLEESWLKTCQENNKMNMLQPFDDMLNGDARPIKARRCPEDNS